MSGYRLAELQFDAKHIWHPYSRLHSNHLTKHANLWVKKAKGCEIWADYLNPNTQKIQSVRLLDAMASWWCAIYGYNHPYINQAIKVQMGNFSHMMFGGMTHEKAVELCRVLLGLTNLNAQDQPFFHSVFLADSGSVAVEVALKMALQYQACQHHTLKKKKNKILSFKNAYHGDTLGAMSVCDPQSIMHSLFNDFVPQQLFAPAPCQGVGDDEVDEAWVVEVEKIFKKYHHQIAGAIIEPLVQGAGGMRFFSAHYLRVLRRLCDEYGVVLIFDEIATGFYRTGRLFAFESMGGLAPDLMCVGKALTGGTLNLAAVLVNAEISHTLSEKEPQAMMHGPTYMANALACSAALANLHLLNKELEEGVLACRIQCIESSLNHHLSSLSQLESVVDVRVLGAIGVVEFKPHLKLNERLKSIQHHLIQKGIWARPFRNLLYTMPPFISSDKKAKSTQPVIEIISQSFKQAVLAGETFL